MASVRHIATDLSEMQIPQEYTVTSSNQQFLQADIQHPARLLLFASPRQSSSCRTVTTGLLMAPLKPAQTSSTRCIPYHPRPETVLSCVYALLANKSHCLFAEVKRLVGTPPVTLLLDFERAASLVFPDTVIKGCFFHLCQKVYRLWPLVIWPLTMQRRLLTYSLTNFQMNYSPSWTTSSALTSAAVHDMHGRRSPSFPLAFWSMWDRMQDRPLHAMHQQLS